MENEIKKILNAKPKEDHKFWDTMPVPKLTEQVKDEGPIELRQLPEVKKEPYALPEGFEWVVFDITNPTDLHSVYQFLKDNYVEDDEGMFRFHYQKEMIQWALLIPGYFKDWHIGVRVTKNKKIVGFISGTPGELVIHGKKMKVCEINFLCVIAQMRGDRLASVLIKEITRKVNLKNIWQAVYTAGPKIPKPVSETRYYHRILDLKKLSAVGFTYIRKNLSLASQLKLLKVKEEFITPGLRLMKESDVPQVHKLLNEFQQKFKIHFEYSLDEVKHLMLPLKNVLRSFVVEKDGKVTDFASYYIVPSSVLKHETIKEFVSGYVYYYSNPVTPMAELVADMLADAKKLEIDVMNSLNIMENQKFFDDLRFGVGDGCLYYYLFNWKIPDLKPEEIGVVLV